jgi:hypothetical protein
VESLGGSLQLGEGRAMKGFETTPLGLVEAMIGKLKAGEIAQRLLVANETLLEIVGAGRKGVLTHLWPQSRPRVLQQALSRRSDRRRAPGGEQGHRLAQRQ